MRILETMLQALMKAVTAQPPIRCCAGINWANFR